MKVYNEQSDKKISEFKLEDNKTIFKAVYHAILNALNNPLH